MDREQPIRSRSSLDASMRMLYHRPRGPVPQPHRRTASTPQAMQGRTTLPTDGMPSWTQKPLPSVPGKLQRKRADSSGSNGNGNDKNGHGRSYHDSPPVSQRRYEAWKGCHESSPPQEDYANYEYTLSELQARQTRQTGQAVQAVQAPPASAPSIHTRTSLPWGANHDTVHTTSNFLRPPPHYYSPSTRLPAAVGAQQPSMAGMMSLHGHHYDHLHNRYNTGGSLGAGSHYGQPAVRAEPPFDMKTPGASSSSLSPNPHPHLNSHSYTSSSHPSPLASSPTHPLRLSPPDRRFQQSTEDFILRTDRAMAREQHTQKLQLQQAERMPPLAGQTSQQPQMSQMPQQRRLSNESQVSAMSIDDALSYTFSRSPSWGSYTSQSSANTSLPPPSPTSPTSLASPAQSKQPAAASIQQNHQPARYPGPVHGQISVQLAGMFAEQQQQQQLQQLQQQQLQQQKLQQQQLLQQQQQQQRLQKLQQLQQQLPSAQHGKSIQWQRPAALQHTAATAAAANSVFAFPTGAPIAASLRRASPNELFAALPGEVLELILDELRELHLGRGSDSCATCWMRDVCAMAVTARKMLKYARAALYEDVQLVGADAPHQRKRFRPQYQNGGGRLVLLRRTLRSNPQIAAIVRTLKVPNLATAAGVPSPSEEYENIVASVVMACPNLERIVGFYPSYDHEGFQRYFQALSTRQRLKEMHWMIQPTLAEQQQEKQQQLLLKQKDDQRSKTHQRKRSKSFTGAVPTEEWPQSALPQQPYHQQQQQQQLTHKRSTPFPYTNFLDLHVSWQHLTTFTVHCQPGATMGPNSTLITDTLARLPALHTLYLSHIPATSFDDMALVRLPALRKLSLVHVSGVSSGGLSAFAARPASRALVSLSLVHTRLDSVQVLARLLSKLTQLERLTVVQQQAPILAEDEVIYLFPYLASASLLHLHWDVQVGATREAGSTSPVPSVAHAADTVLARSISADGFPALQTLRVLSDADGTFQALCRPQLRAILPGDRWRAESRAEKTETGSKSEPAAPTKRSRPFHVRSNSKTNVHAASATPTPVRMYGDLLEARLAAQARIEAARAAPRFLIRIVDAEQDKLVEQHAVGGFVGAVHSRIAYHLLPDDDDRSGSSSSSRRSGVAGRGGSDAKGGLVDVDDLVGDGGEAVALEDGSTTLKKEAAAGTASAASLPDGCTGRWKANWELSQKKDRERWWHAERGRWRGVTLS